MQGYRQVCHTIDRKDEGPRTPSESTDTQLDSAFVDDVLLILLLRKWGGGAGSPLHPLDAPLVV